MANRFKGVELDARLKRVVPHMAMAQEYGGALQQLQLVWDNLSLLGQLSGSGTDMTNTRRAFSELASDLLNQLGTEALKKCLQDASSKAQVAINILVRNLFERTADIGFFACDEDIRTFLRESREGGDQSGALATLRARFGEYVRKYSVYSDVILLDPKGNVVARLDDSVPTAASSDPVIREAIETKAGYVERFGETDLASKQNKSLIYAFRVVDDNGLLLGVLCLCFRFEHEVELIFSNLVKKDDWTVVTILDAAGVVIASSDPFHIPIGVTLTPVLDSAYEIMKFGPMEYLATSRPAQPYQGYGGPKWYGHVLVPIHHAFDNDESQSGANVDSSVLTSVAHSSELFSEAIRNIPLKAEHILRDLNRSLWNGSVSQTQAAGTQAFSRILLKEISETGARTKDVFGGSITDLHQTVVTSLLRDNQSQAALAIDIMDRNLYERANDCRWWALTSIFSNCLSDGQHADQVAKAIGSVLRAINNLYTVYTNLIVFDRSGKIAAVSNAAENSLIGTTLSEDWVAAILALRDAQGYAVSPFAPTALYGDRSTYIYGAAIRSSKHQQVVGGVAIVFDAEPQFVAMLKDALPRDSTGEVKSGTFGVFVEPDGRVIACSDERFRSGEMLQMDEAFLRLEPGTGNSGVVALGDSYYAVGAKASSGYREYKDARDAYKNELVALILTRLCDVRAKGARQPVPGLSIRSDRMQSGDKEDIATFLVGRRWFAARTVEIVETIDGSNVVPLPFMPPGMIGCVLYREAPLPVLDLTTVAGWQRGPTPLDRRACQIVVMTLANDTRFGLLVDDVGEIVEVLTSRLAPLPAMVADQQTFADAAIACDDSDDSELVVVLRADRLHASLSISAGPAAALGAVQQTVRAGSAQTLAKSA